MKKAFAKKEFDRVSDRQRAMILGEMYAEKALVAVVSVNDNAPPEAVRDFAGYLKASKVPHDVLYMGTRAITFATTRDPDVDTLGAESKTRKMVAGFFRGAYADAFNMEAYYQKRSPENTAADDKIIPFAKVKRSVQRRAA